MKICIVGSRSITDFCLTPYVPNDAEMIITGGAKGVDTLAEEYADAHGIAKLIIRPEYSLYGRAAPLKRNEQMIYLSDFVLVIWDGISRGSAYAIRYAEKTGKPMRVVRVGGE